MKAIYDFEVTGEGPAPAVSEHTFLNPIEIDEVRIDLTWDAESRQLTHVKLTISGVEIRRDPITKSILSTYPELEAKAFSAASFVANVLRVETGHDGVDPFAVVGEDPTLHAETPEEEQVLASEPRTVRRSMGIQYNTRKLLAASEWQHWGQSVADKRVRKALTSYAEGIRVQSPFLRYEQFYKVVEHFYPNKQGKELDSAVGRHLTALDPSLQEGVIRRLRELRNRIVHSEPSAGPHLSPQHRDDIREVTAEIPQLQHVAQQLLLHPPN